MRKVKKIIIYEKKKIKKIKKDYIVFKLFRSEVFFFYVCSAPPTCAQDLETVGRILRHIFIRENLPDKALRTS